MPYRHYCKVGECGTSYDIGFVFGGVLCFTLSNFSGTFSYKRERLDWNWGSGDGDMDVKRVEVRACVYAFNRI